MVRPLREEGGEEDKRGTIKKANNTSVKSILKADAQFWGMVANKIQHPFSVKKGSTILIKGTETGT